VARSKAWLERKGDSRPNTSLSVKTIFFTQPNQKPIVGFFLLYNFHGSYGTLELFSICALIIGSWLSNCNVCIEIYTLPIN
jgi:hypothetical protein